MLNRVILVVLLARLLFGCDRQERIERCMESCNVTVCRPDSGLTLRQSEPCQSCFRECHNAR
jgi:hypothetical protein